MRPRKWVLVAAFLLSIVASGLVLVKHRLERDRKLEGLLIDAVAASIKGVCTVDAVRIGFFSVYMHNVSVTLPLQSFKVTIREIKVGLSFARLFRHRTDISRAINQIILIGPRFDFSAAMQNEDSLSRADSFSDSGPVFSEPSVQCLYVKDGVMRFFDHNGDTVVLAGKIGGMLQNGNAETVINLHGACGSSRRNLSIQGTLSNGAGKHHLSLRLDQARVGRRIAFDGVTITEGALNGALECTFSNPFSADSSEFHGWAHLKGGSVAFRDAPKRIDSIGLRVSIDNHKFRVAEFGAVFRGMKLSAKGAFDITRDKTGRIDFSCYPFTPGLFADLLPDSLPVHFSGCGHAAGSVSWVKEGEPRCSLKVEDVAVNDMPVRSAVALLRIAPNRIVADSISLDAALFKFSLHGYYGLDTAITDWDAGFAIVCDSLPDTSGFTGSLYINGTATASSDGKPTVDCRVSAQNLGYRHISFGNQNLVASLIGDRCTFRSVEVDTSVSVVFFGVIDSVFSDTPFASCAISIGNGPIKRQLSRMHGMPEIDSANISVNVSGWINSFSAAADLSLGLWGTGGTLHAEIDRLPSDTGALVWTVSSRNVYYKDVLIPIWGKGTVYDTVVVVDTLNCWGGIRGRARIYHTGKRPGIDARFEYDKPVSHLARLVAGGAGLDSGTVSGFTTVKGPLDSLVTASSIKLLNIGNDELRGFSADLSIRSEAGRFRISPFVVKRDIHPIISFDTISNTTGHIEFSATVSDLTPSELLGPMIVGSPDIDASLSGTFTTSGDGMPLSFTLFSPHFVMDTLRLDSISCRGTVSAQGVSVTGLDFRDGNRTSGRVEGMVPWGMLGNNPSDFDTLRCAFKLEGDLLATIQNNFRSPIGGNCMGNADVAFTVSGGNWRFTKGTVSLPLGTLRVWPFVLDNVKNYTCRITIDSNAVVHTDMNGTIKRRPIRIFSVHSIPDGFEPFMIGPLNFGMFQTVTPKKGVDLHLPGFMAIKERGNIEFRGRKPFDNFTISGPIERIRLTGTWILRDLEFTFPFLQFNELGWEHDPFPYVTWDMDIRPGDRKVLYYWDLAGKRNRILRFVEGYLDPSSLIKVRGRDLDKTFRVYGTIRSYKGAAYYGRVFDRNFDVGVEFIPHNRGNNSGYDNMPLLWGSAEAFSDSSRQERIKLTCMVNDPVTGAVSEKGRLADQPSPNITFHLSSEGDWVPGESEREYYRQAGITFTSLEGAGGAVSDFGEQMFHRYLLQRWERRLARKLGLDVMNIETSIVSNYFSKLYGRQFNGLLNEDDYLALANVGVTVGRYFFSDFLLLKARGELIPIDMALTPEYSIGLEFQPSRFLTMDVNYGFHMTETAVEHSPQLMLQLRLPITRLRNLWKF